MTDVAHLTKKAFTWSVVTATILWSMGAAALIPLVAQAAECPSLAAGAVVKVASSSSVFLINSDLKRMYFPNAEVYKTWFKDYSNVQTITPACLENYPTFLGNGVNYRPGSRLVKSTVTPSVYAVGANNTRHKIASEAVAAALYGAKWATVVRDVADVFMGNLADGAELASAKPHDGMLVKKASSADVYLVTAGKYVKVDGALSTQASGDVRTVSDAVFAAVEVGTGSVAAGTVVDNPSQKTGGSVTPTTGGSLTVSLAANTPSAGYIAKGAYNAEFTKLTFKASAAGAVRVDKLVIKRDGLGSDADITAVRLWDGAKQLGSDQSLNTNTHLATFNNLNWDLKAGETKTLTVSADTYASAAGTNDFLAATVVELEGTGSVSASLPLAGNAMQYHSVTMGVLDVDALTTPGATTIISGSTDQEIACFNFDTDSAEGFNVKSITLTNNGTASNDEVSNFVLKDGATVIGKNTGTFGTGGTVTIDMSEKPYFLDKSKSKNLCVSADIKGGITTTKTVILQIAESKHVVAAGDSSKAQVIVTKDNATPFTAQSSQTMSIGQGTLTVAMNTATSPVAAGLIDGVTHNKLAAYKFTAGSTEGALVTRLRLSVSGTGVTATDLSNFELYTYDETTGKETMVGASQGMSGTTVTFEDTSSGLFEVAAGKNVIVHAYADVNTSAAWGDVVAVYIGATNSNLIVKAKGVKSGEFVPASGITLSSVDQTDSGVIDFTNSNQGTLVVSLDNASAAATSVSKGSTGVNFATYKLYATGEDVSVTSIIVRAYNSDGNTNSTASGTNDFVNVKLWDVSGATPVQIGQTVATPSSGASTFSFSLTVPKDGYKLLKVTADVPTNSSASYLHFRLPGAGTIADDITSTGSKSGVDLTETGSANGRTMTVAAPTITVSWGSTPVAQSIVSSAQGVTVANLQLTAGQYEDVKVTSIKVSADDDAIITNTSSADSSVSNLKLVDATGKQYGVTKNLTSGTPDSVTFDGITDLTITKGQTKTLYVKVNVDGTSGTYYFGSTSTADIVGSGATSGNSATITGTGQGKGMTLVSSATIAFALDASSAATSVVAVGASGTGTEVSMLTVSADASFEDVDLTKLVFLYEAVSGDNAIAAFGDNGLKLYVKKNNGTETLVGSTSFVSTTGAYNTATFNLADGALRVGKDDTVLLIVKAVLNGTETGAASASSPMLQFGDGTVAETSFVTAKGVSSGSELAVGSINGSSNISIDGNDKVLYRSAPTFTFVSLGSTTLTNAAENDVYKFKIKAASTGNVAIKQLKFDIDLVDNISVAPNNAAVMTAGAFKVYRNGEEISSTVLKLQNQVGATVRATNTFSSTTGQSLYLTWLGTNEEVIAAGQENTYTIKATLNGFTVDQDDDYVRLRLANSQYTSEMAVATDLYYLSAKSGLGGGVDVVVLSNSTQSTTSTASMADIIWSDRSAASHSAATGTYVGGTATSTGDWFNGYYVTDTPTNYATLIR